MQQYTSAEMAQKIGKAAVTVRVLAAKDGIGKKIGRDWVFTDEDVTRFKALRIGKPRGKPRARRAAPSPATDAPQGEPTL